MIASSFSLTALLMSLIMLVIFRDSNWTSSTNNYSTSIVILFFWIASCNKFPTMIAIFCTLYTIYCWNLNLDLPSLFSSCALKYCLPLFYALSGLLDGLTNDLLSLWTSSRCLSSIRMAYLSSLLCLSSLTNLSITDYNSSVTCFSWDNNF